MTEPPHERECSPNLVVQDGSISELAEKISFYLPHEKEHRLMVDPLYHKAINELSWAAVARRTLDLYRR
jgi:glycosyltransferase involved in cell wall biosynthesis